MSIAFVQEKSSSSNAADQSLAFDSNVGAGSLIAVAIRDSGDAGTGSSTVTDNRGSTYTLANQEAAGSGTTRLYVGITASGGPCTVTIGGGSGVAARLTITEFSGSFASTTPDDINNAAGDTSPLNTGSVTPSAPVALLLAVVSTANDTDFTGAGSGWTPNAESGAARVLLAYRIISAIAAHSATFSWSSGDTGAGAVIAAFVEDAGSPALVVNDQPSSTASGYQISPDVVVRATSDGSTTDTAFTGNVTAALLGAGGVLLGTLTVAAVAGLATFSNLRPCEAGTYSLRFTASGYTTIDSDPFTVTSGSGALVTGGDMPTVQIRRNEGTAALRRIYLLIEDEAGAPWAGSVSGVKAEMSQNGGAETPSPADIVRVGGKLHYVECAQPYTDTSEGGNLCARVPAASGRREAMGTAVIIPSDSYAAAVNLPAVVRAVVRASLGFDGWIQRIIGEELELTEPGVGTATVPVGLNGAPTVKALGATE